MSSPITGLAHLLKTLAVTDTKRKLDPLLELRHAIDQYQSALGYEAERRLVERIDWLPVEHIEHVDAVDAPIDSGVARENVVAALHAALTSFSPERPIVIDPPATTHEPVPLGRPEAAGTVRLDACEANVPPAAVESLPMCSQALSPAELAAYFDQLRSTPAEPTADRRQARATERQTLRDLLYRVGEIPDLTSSVAVIEELEKIEGVSDDTTLARWDALGEVVLHYWLTMLVARLRALRERIDVGSSLHQRHRLVINRLPAYQKTREAKRFVNGMAKAHGPKHATWTDDARSALAELRGDADDAIEGPASAGARGPRRSATRAPAKHVEWPYRSVVATMRILLFGGTPREDARQNIESSLGIRELTWPVSERPRQLSALLEGLPRFDVILVNRLVNHKESTALVAAAKAQGKPFCVIDSYGVDTVRRALTELLDVSDQRRRVARRAELCGGIRRSRPVVRGSGRA